MTVYLINPSHVSFGIGVITPRWLYVLAVGDAGRVRRAQARRRNARAVRPGRHPATGDIVGIGIHTGNALRGYEIGDRRARRGRLRRVRRHSRDAVSRRGARTRRRARGRHRRRRARLAAGAARLRGGHAGGSLRRRPRSRARRSCRAAGICCRQGRYMWASVQTVRGCPKHCSFCSVWRTDGQRPRQRHVDRVLDEIVELRRRGFRFIALADDNFYPVTLEDLRHGRAPQGQERAATAARRSATSGSS